MNGKFDRIAALNDLVQVAQAAGAELKKQGPEWRGKCPLHGGSNDTGFAIYEEGGKQRWKCFSGDCGGGDVYDFTVAWLGNKERADAYLGGNITVRPEEMVQIASERTRRAEENERRKWTEYQAALSELRAARAWENYWNNLTESAAARQMWRARGIPDDFQALWQLGYCPSFTYSSGGVVYSSPSLTIPIFDKDPDPVNIRHRLLKPVNPADKYRPERPGLHAAPFIADPERDGELERVLVVEGEIKAAVTYLTMDDTTLQVYGIPGKSSFRKLVDRLQGRRVYICFDPDAGAEAAEAARLVGGLLIRLPAKIDDAILDGSLDKGALRRLLVYARRA
jgi:hypothetical protein